MSKLLKDLQEKDKRLSDPNRPAVRSSGASSFITGPGQLGAFRNEALRYQERIDELTRQVGQGMDIPLAKLHEVPGRRRYLTPEQYAELKRNLANNPLVSPITVSPRADGDYDIVAGNNRTAIYRELGRETIKGVLGRTDEEQAEFDAFYSNLLQHALTDYEKYIGFRKIREMEPDLTLETIAERAGISDSQLGYIMKFQDLPEPVLKLLDKNPAILGATAARALAGVSAEGKADRVISAVEMLSEGKIDQTRAVKLAMGESASSASPAAASTFKVRAGRATFCDMRRAKNVMRLQFASEEQAAGVEEAIKEVLTRLAEQAKTSK